VRVRRGQTVFATLLASLVMSGLVTGWGVGPARAANKGDRESWQAASTVVVQAITTLSQSTFESVGIQPTVAAPVILHGQSKLAIDGKPEIFYEGAEPCPYCAAERWAFIIALARFGTWSGLGNAQSAKNDVDPSTQSFTFLRAKFSSPYVALETREILGNRTLPNGHFASLQSPTPEEARLDNTYTSAKYFPANPGYLPFVDFGNRVVISQSSYDPFILHGLSREQIVADLSDTTNPVTLDIVATANYLTAATCLIDGNRPSAVCQSPGIPGLAVHFVKASYGFGPTSCTSSKGQSVCGGTNASGQNGAP